MMQSMWSLGWRTLWRDVRSGELRLLVLAVTLAVAALTAVGFFADRLQAGLQRDARQLLGGDAVIASDRPAPAFFAEQARTLGLKMVNTQGFPTMARTTQEQGGNSKLVALKSVEPGYPLRGTLRIKDALGVPERPARGIPAPGSVWVDAQLLDALGIGVGDSLLLGERSLQVQAIIVIEPDRGAGFMNFSPRVMLNSQDLASTALVQPASRVNYRLAVAGEDAQIKRFVDVATQRIKAGHAAPPEHVANAVTPAGDKEKNTEVPSSEAGKSAPDAEPLRGVRIESTQTGRPEMGQTLGRAEKFLSLVALLAALLSAVAVALAARSFAAKHLDDCAMLRVLGLSQRTIAGAYAWEFALVGLFASALGVCIGFGVHYLFVLLLAGLVDAQLPQPGLAPAALGMGMGLTLLFAFGLPPVLQLAQVPPLRVIRRDVGNLRPASLGVLALGVAGFAALLLVVSSDLKLGLIAVAGFAGAVLLFAVLSWLAIKLLRASVNESSAPRALVLATRQIAARPAFTVVQVSALAVGLLALVLLVLLRTDLIASWRKATPPDAPNRFVINVSPEQSDAFVQSLREAGVKKFDWFPMIRGRLVAINGTSVSSETYTEDFAKRLVDREFNISYSAKQPDNNLIIDGQWTPEEAGAISMEEGIATTLGLQVGDTLRFDMAGVTVDSKITSLRKVDWGSMRANFYALYPVSVLEGVPATFMGSFKAPLQAGFDNALVRRFPNVTNVDMSATINQVQRILDQVIRAVEFLFGFTLAAGLVVLFAAVSATREERAREYAIMRAVGAQNSLLRQVQRLELAGVGLLAGFLASLVASALGWALARYVFEFSWTVSLWVPVLGALAGAALALMAGWWGLRDVLRRPVVETLRKATS
jgi:putative ABC transport system permease protein